MYKAELQAHDLRTDSDPKILWSESSQDIVYVCECAVEQLCLNAPMMKNGYSLSIEVSKNE